MGRFRFLDLSISLHELYPTILSRLTTSSPPPKFLDFGCCFGQDIRKLITDGVSGENLYGADLRSEFIELGYELFRDKDKLKARFVQGDVLAEGGAAAEALLELDGKRDVIYAASFFHLFSWTDQVRVAIRMARFFNQQTHDAVIFGRQVGSTVASEYSERGASKDNSRYVHNEESFQQLWDEVGEKTETKWKVKVKLVEVEDWLRTTETRATDRMMWFEVHRL